MFDNPLSVAFVEDDLALRTASAQSLELAGIKVNAFASAKEALAAIGADFPGVVVTDIRMPDMDGRQLFRALREFDEDLPVIFITGHADISEAVEALHHGAYDYLPKPYGPERLVGSVRRALDKRRLVLDNRSLVQAAARAETDGALIGQSPVMERLRSTIRQVAQAQVDVLLEGETGVGKELIARLIHRSSPRRTHPFVAIDLAAMPESVAESELFGHEIGAYGSAARRRTGRIESADRGTLFLDEIESMPPAMQGKLLRILEEREICPVGSNEVRHVDLRVIAAAKEGLASLVESGAMRRDLFYRLNAVHIRIPPLRERRSDVPLLFAHFLARASAKFGRPQPPLTGSVRLHLVSHDWPGNVRELAHFAERTVLGVHNLDNVVDDEEYGSLPQRVEAYEAQLIREVLASNHGDAQSAVQALGIPRKTFYDKLRKHQIDIKQYRT